MRIIGITGSIGSGKSTVTSFLKEAGAYVINADSVSAQVTTRGGKAFSQLVQEFGETILFPDGELNRGKLAEIVFSNPEKLTKLNNITHKYIVESIIEQINNIKLKHNDGIIVLDAPIPLKHGFIDVVEEVWVVLADKQVREQRIMKRSGINKNEAIKRINAQMDDENYLKLADKVIYNNGTLDELRKKTEDLLSQSI